MNKITDQELSNSPTIEEVLKILTPLAKEKETQYMKTWRLQHQDKIKQYRQKHYQKVKQNERSKPTTTTNTRNHQKTRR